MSININGEKVHGSTSEATPQDPEWSRRTGDIQLVVLPLLLQEAPRLPRKSNHLLIISVFPFSLPFPSIPPHSLTRLISGAFHSPDLSILSTPPFLLLQLA